MILAPGKTDEVISSSESDHQMSNRPLGPELGWVSESQPEIINRMSGSLEQLTVPGRLRPRQISEDLEPPGPMPLQRGESGLDLRNSSFEIRGARSHQANLDRRFRRNLLRWFFDESKSAGDHQKD